MKLLIKYAKKQDGQKRMSLENLSVPSKVLKIKDSLYSGSLLCTFKINFHRFPLGINQPTQLGTTG